MRYIIGIDLGTTNSALTFIDTEGAVLSVQLFSVPQLTGVGKVSGLSTLPSFCYLAAPGEWSPGALALPWKGNVDVFVGEFAKQHGARVPTRLVQSAKSWLCNVSANRRDKILPLESDDLSNRISPVEASAKFLEHLRDAWNGTMAKGESSLALEEQEVVLTVPASFDEVARALTVEAARKVGFLHITLIEEPQAAFYSWIAQHEQEWESYFQSGETILVCDIGGGTTDFSLIEIHSNEKNLSFQRMAVGDHLLLGGDNIDIALAHYLEQKLKEAGHPPLESHQWLQLKAEARAAKEALLAPKEEAKENYSVVLQGVGSSVLKGSLSVVVSRREVEALLSPGFFGLYPLDEASQICRSRGFRSLGLPYEDEPSITKHLARFLKQAGQLEKGKGVDYILFNGGTVKPKIFQEAIEKSLQSWFPQTPLRRLESSSLDLAVARGASYYGKVRRGLGVAIGGGTPRSYYLKIDVKEGDAISSQALTLLPRGSLEGAVFQPDHVFALRPNTPVAFHILTSHVRLHDKEGDFVPIDPNEMQALPSIQTVLRFGRKQVEETSVETLPVRLGIKLTPIGTIELWLDSQVSGHRWELEFQIRSATGQEAPAAASNERRVVDETFEAGHLEEAKEVLTSLFEPSSIQKPGKVMERLEALIGAGRREWGPTILRELWASLLKAAPYRKLSAELEARWWNLAGFFLRPGYGFPLDDFRMKELWKILLGEFKSKKTSECLVQMCICVRRVAGGLNRGQQMQVATDLIGTVIDKKTGKIDLKRKGDSYLYSEKIRALASLERVDLPFKMKLGEALSDRIIHDQGDKGDCWALGRIGARHLLHGSAGHVIPRGAAAKWVEKLLANKKNLDDEALLFLMRQLARKTDQRELNLSESLIQQILKTFPQSDLEEWILKEKKIDEAEQEQLYGDRVPTGLLLTRGSTNA